MLFLLLTVVIRLTILWSLRKKNVNVNKYTIATYIFPTPLKKKKSGLTVCFASKIITNPKPAFLAENLFSLKCELKPIQGLPLTRHPSGRSCN